MASVGFDMEFGPFEPDSPGIMETFRGAGMQAALAPHAKRMQDAANAEARLRGHGARYAGGVDVASRTAIGWVSTGNVASRYDEGTHHTLEHQNH